MKKGMLNYLNLALFGLLLAILSSCMNIWTVRKNYEFATDDTCDCYTKHPFIMIGGKSNYHSKQKAFCTRWSYPVRSDSISKLRDSINELEYGPESGKIPEDSIEIRVNALNGIIDKLETGWTHSRIKTKWKNSSKGAIILKQKVKFYNKFNFGRKFVGMKKFKNGSLVKIKFEEQIRR